MPIVTPQKNPNGARANINTPRSIRLSSETQQKNRLSIRKSGASSISSTAGKATKQTVPRTPESNGSCALSKRNGSSSISSSALKPKAIEDAAFTPSSSYGKRNHSHPMSKQRSVDKLSSNGTPHLLRTSNSKPVSSTRKVENRTSTGSAIRESRSRLQSQISSSPATTPLTANHRPRWSESGLSESSPALRLPPSLHDAHAEESSSAVTVAVRVRPLSKKEEETDGVTSAVSVCGREVTVFTDACHTFAYDHCFSDASQEHVYHTLMQPLLDRALQGYNTCLFAYGQTGSGKTYSILGEESGAHAGIIPRFCRDLFTRAEVRGRTASTAVSPDTHYSTSRTYPGTYGERVQYQVELSYVEIYNEKLYDLVGEEEEEGGAREALRVREHPVTGPHVVGAAVHPVTSYEQLKYPYWLPSWSQYHYWLPSWSQYHYWLPSWSLHIKLPLITVTTEFGSSTDVQTWLSLGNRERSIAATGMNDKSSRSHSVFSLKLTRTQVESVGGEELQHSRVSNISIVDLAGSERLSSSSGDRMKEGVCINKSLLTLGKVITALAESATGKRRCFVPYRESVLTWLLKESLGGNSETAMLATVSPASHYAEETLATLRYAGQARNIVNVKHVNEDPAARIIRSLKAEVERLKARQSPRVSPVRLFVTDTSAVTPQQQRQQGLQHEQEEQRREILKREQEITALKAELQSSKGQLVLAKDEWQRRLEQSARAAAAALEKCKKAGISVRLDQEVEDRPCLVNLCDDEHLSEHLRYALKDGPTTLGAPQADLVLQGLHTPGVHCTITNEKGRLTLTANSGYDVFVNGVSTESQRVLHHKDRLVVGGVYFLLVWIPEEESCTGYRDGSSSGRSHVKAASGAVKVDFAFAKEELLQCQEQRLRKQILEEEEQARRELLNELQQQKQSVKQLQMNLENQKSCVKSAEAQQHVLQEEKQELEQQLQQWQQLTQQLEGGSSFLAMDASEADISVAPPPQDSSFFQKVEELLDKSHCQLEMTGTRDRVPIEHVDLLFSVQRANKMSDSLGLGLTFVAQNEVLGGSGVVQVLVMQSERQLSALQSPASFNRTLRSMQDVAAGRSVAQEVMASIEWGGAPEGRSLIGSPGVGRRNASLASDASFSAGFNSSLDHSFMFVAGPNFATRPSKRRSSAGELGALRATASSCVTALQEGGMLCCGRPLMLTALTTAVLLHYNIVVL
ncbi:Kinesin motor domain [Trinorchestia longiramus]|nr:Kinesin motor domain [Trinorchestia longiramus]